MEISQQKLINEVLPYVVNEMISNTSLLMKLMTKGLLSNDDFESIASHSTNTEKNYRLIRILITRVDAFLLFYEALVEEGQIVAADIILMEAEQTHPENYEQMIKINNKHHQYQLNKAVTVTSSAFPPHTKHLPGSRIYYTLDSIIGSGSTSIVYEGFFIDSSTKAAVKQLNSQHFQIYANELKIWNELQSETRSKENLNVVTLLDWTSQTVGKDTVYYFCMERADYNLYARIERIEKNKNLPIMQEKFKRDMAQLLHQAAQGLSWLHTRKPEIIHRDIKPQNILIFVTNSGEIAKIGDFGTCRKTKTLNQGTVTNPIGTPGWMPPEALVAIDNGERYTTTKAVDIFSFGMTCQYSYSHCIPGKGSHPFAESEQHKKNLTSNIKDDGVRPVPLGLSTPDHLFQWMMEKVPEDRPQIEQVLQHPFFWGLKKSFKFLVDFAKHIDLNTDEMKIFRDEIDKKNYKIMKVKNTDWNWKLILDESVMELIVQRKSNSRSSKYDEKSVTSLVKLIRDKYMHPEDLVDALLDEKYFGVKKENDQVATFSEKKYSEYFLSRFQDIIMFLYIFTCDMGPNSTGVSKCLAPLFDDYEILKIKKNRWV